jgi:hypothetical protein
MSKFSKGISWREHRLADRLDLDGREYTVDLVARKGTGVQGFRVTIVYLPHDEGETVQVDLPNAPTTTEVHRRVRELGGDEDRLRALFREAPTP